MLDIYGSRKKLYRPEPNEATKVILGSLPSLEAFHDGMTEGEVISCADGAFSGLASWKTMTNKHKEDTIDRKKALAWVKSFFQSLLLRLAPPLKKHNQKFPVGFSIDRNLFAEGLELIEKYQATARELRVIGDRVHLIRENRWIVQFPNVSYDVWSCLRAEFASNVVDSLDYRSGENGLFWFGCCPRCAKLFQKRRSDSVFCCTYCASEGTRGESKSKGLRGEEEK